MGFFTCGSKKKSKEKTMQQLQSDPKKCQVHQKDYEFICISGDVCKQEARKTCQMCNYDHNGCTLIPLKQVQQFLQEQNTMDLVLSIKKSLSQCEWEKQWREQLQKNLKYLESVVQRFEEEILMNFILKGDQLPKTFNPSDVDLILNSQVVGQMDDLVNQIKNLSQVDEDAIYLLTKVSLHNSDTQTLLNTLKNEKDIKAKLDHVDEELKAKISRFEKSLQQMTQSQQQQIEVQHDPTLDFITQAKQQTQQQNKQLQEQLSKIQKKKHFEPAQQQNNEHYQIKSICQLNDSVVYCTNQNLVHLVNSTDLSSISSLEAEGDVMTLASTHIKGESVLVIGLEDQGMNLITFWSLTLLSRIGSINAHQGYIWNIINLPSNQLASCSDDNTVKVWDPETQKEIRTIHVHQAAVNDIALVSPTQLVSVGDDQMLALSNFTNGNMDGIQQDDFEIKCVVALDGLNFATGNTHGQVSVYSITNLERLLTVKIHDLLIRNLSRVSPTIIVTASWDGFHIFLSTEDGSVIKKIEGPKKNFSEGILWNQNQLIAGSAGRLMLYK